VHLMASLKVAQLLLIWFLLLSPLPSMSALQWPPQSKRRVISTVVVDDDPRAAANRKAAADRVRQAGRFAKATSSTAVPPGPPPAPRTVDDQLQGKNNRIEKHMTLTRIRPVLFVHY
jgi:hypothetical protein